MMTKSIRCPYCGESNSVEIDDSVDEIQEYVQDCFVCCRPWHLTVQRDENRKIRVDVATE